MIDGSLGISQIPKFDSAVLTRRGQTGFRGGTPIDAVNLRQVSRDVIDGRRPLPLIPYAQVSVV